MTDYQTIVAFIAAANLLLSLAALVSARAKAGTDRIDRLEAEMRAALKAHDDRFALLGAAIERAASQDHLADVYRDLAKISQQVHTLLGQQEQMNENLRLLLAQVVRGGGGSASTVRLMMPEAFTLSLDTSSAGGTDLEIFGVTKEGVPIRLASNYDSATKVWSFNYDGTYPEYTVQPSAARSTMARRRK